MNLENSSMSEYGVELSITNQRRLKALMGEEYNGMEMEDYMSYLQPEQAANEIDMFEEKLGRLRQTKEELIKGFKAHLGYLAG